MSASDSQKLKQLETRKTKLDVQLRTAAEDLSEAQSIHSKVKNQINIVHTEISNLTKMDVVISEHAILRYLERVKGVDVEAIKAEMLSNSTRSAIKQLGSGKYPIDGGNKLVVKNNTIVSVT